MEPRHLRVGVLAMQGDFREHIDRLRALDVDAVEVRTAEQLASVDGLIIPGGESTTIARLLIEQHGGTIEVASASGEGSEFTVRLPSAA